MQLQSTLPSGLDYKMLAEIKFKYHPDDVYEYQRQIEKLFRVEADIVIGTFTVTP